MEINYPQWGKRRELNYRVASNSIGERESILWRMDVEEQNIVCSRVSCGFMMVEENFYRGIIISTSGNELGLLFNIQTLAYFSEIKIILQRYRHNGRIFSLFLDKREKCEICLHFCFLSN